jgi:hypothetical protein
MYGPEKSCKMKAPREVSDSIKEFLSAVKAAFDSFPMDLFTETLKDVNSSTSRLCGNSEEAARTPSWEIL